MEILSPSDPCFTRCYSDIIRVFRKWHRLDRALTFYEILSVADPANRTFPIGIATCWKMIRNHLSSYSPTVTEESDLVQWALRDLKTISAPGLASLNIEHYCPLSFIYYLEGLG